MEKRQTLHIAKASQNPLHPQLWILLPPPPQFVLLITGLFPPPPRSSKEFQAADVDVIFPSLLYFHLKSRLGHGDTFGTPCRRRALSAASHSRTALLHLKFAPFRIDGEMPAVLLCCYLLLLKERLENRDKSPVARRCRLTSPTAQSLGGRVE